MTNPYEILGVRRDASDDQIKAAYRRRAKSTHPDSGGDPAAFGRVQKAYELLLDPVRRKVFDDTGYDVELADPVDLQALIVIEKLVNELTLDEREPGSFDPLARMRSDLSEEMRKARFSKRELERHAARIEHHLERLEKRPTTDILGSMLRARIKAITTAVNETEAKIKASERACEMLYDYSYEVDLREGDEALIEGEDAVATLSPKREERPLWVVPAAAQEG
ncbi:DnaJ domain-containing protein (plasmid) [Rhizobium grahamii]|uniref:DnaJ domain-containing protein n=1 Tax=Rhizobium grahamii TaxID=1120045 RepID=A0A5Q0CE52_9HYPH|nr:MULTISPECIES: J domain-containing protein [Rhizobium]QFY64118.1 DnaJ domain-containing protein [Rhizobium grahamii]QRM53010.1 DnaJ domain-containing protein [Rhizobium sp. BG6]